MNKLKNSRFLNNPIAALILISSVPFVAVLIGIWIVGEYGRVPGGETTTCEQNLQDTTIKLEKYTYLAGLSTFELQTFSKHLPDEDIWEEILQVDVQEPRGISCDNAIITLTEGIYALVTRKALAITKDEGNTWQVLRLCEAFPLPDRRCNLDVLDLVSVTFDDTRNGTVIIQESIVDEYGKPITENGEPLLAGVYHFTTDNGGQTWRFAEQS